MKRTLRIAVLIMCAVMMLCFASCGKDATDEEKAIRNVNSGAYWFRREDLISSLGKLTTDNAAHEYYLTDTIYILKQEGKNAGVFVTENADVVLGANDREQLQALNDIAARNFPEAVK